MKLLTVQSSAPYSVYYNTDFIQTWKLFTELHWSTGVVCRVPLLASDYTIDIVKPSCSCDNRLILTGASRLFTFSPIGN